MKICPKCGGYLIQKEIGDNRFYCQNKDCILVFVRVCFKCELPKTLCICGMESIGK